MSKILYYFQWKKMESIKKGLLRLIQIVTVATEEL